MKGNQTEKFAQALFSISGFAACGYLGLGPLQEAFGTAGLHVLAEVVVQKAFEFLAVERDELNSGIQELLKASFVKALREVKTQYPKSSESTISDLLEDIIVACERSSFSYKFGAEQVSSYCNSVLNGGDFLNSYITDVFKGFGIHEPEYESSFISYFRTEIQTLPIKYYREALTEPANQKVLTAHNIIFQQELIADLLKKGIQADKIEGIVAAIAKKIQGVRVDGNLLEMLAAGTMMKFGLEYLDSPRYKSTTERWTYRDYINSNFLPYVTRNEFAKSGQLRIEQKFLVEQELIQKISDDGEWRGILIYGEGGIGKTRLMRELGYLLRYEGCLVLNVKPKLVSADTLNDFINDYLPKAKEQKLILLFDYIEEHALFRDIIDSLFLSGSELTRNIRFIANCRRTFDWENASRIAEIAFPLDVSIENEAEALYKKYVVGKIIEPVNELSRQGDDFFEKRPAFAVFVRYLHENYSEDTSILDTRVGFGNWLFGRLALSIYGNRDDIKSLYSNHTLFQLFAVMPSYDNVTTKLTEAYQESIESLLKDGWLEQLDEGGHKTLRVVQDTITDQLLIIYLKHYSGTVQASFDRLFDFSRGFNIVKSVFISLDRIGDQEIITSNRDKFLESVKKLIKGLPVASGLEKGEYFFFSSRLAETKILSEEEKLQLYAENTTFFDAYITSRYFGNNLSYALNYYSKISTEKRGVKIEKILNHLLIDIWYPANKNFIDDETTGAKILSTYFKYTGNVFFPDNKLQEYLLTHPPQSLVDPINGSFILTSYILSGGPLDAIRAYCKAWLARYDVLGVAPYITRAWLRVSRDTDFVKQHVQNWLAEFDKDESARFVYKSWLDAKGDREFVKPHIQNWLAEFDKDESAAFVYQSWLDAKGDAEFIKQYIQNWLAEFDKDESAAFVYKSWLDAKGDPEFAKLHIQNWLVEFDKNESARFVYKSWLDAKGDPEFAKQHIQNWLVEFDKDESARFVYKSWLDAKGDREFVKPHIQNWLVEFDKDESAAFVYQSWLDAKGDAEFIKQYIQNWLAEFDKDESAAFVYKSWLDAKGDPEFIKQYIQNWLVEFDKDESAAFVYQSWLDAKGDAEFIKQYIQNWLVEFDKDETAQFVYKSWLDAKGDTEFVKPHLQNWLVEFDKNESARFVYKSWLDAKGDTEFAKLHLQNWLVEFDKDESAQFVYKSWLDAKGDTEFAKLHLQNWLAEFDKDESAAFVYQSWLDAKGDTEFVKGHIQNWLVEFDKDESARFVYKSWLDAKGDREFVKPHLQNWLVEFDKDESAAFVYQSWLDAKGDTEFVKPHLQNWLVEFDKNESARFVYKSWLDAKGDTEFAKLHLQNWLVEFDKDESAQFVYKSWLDAKGDTEFAKLHLQNWLAEFDKDESAAFVYQSWLDAKGDPEFAKPHMQNWLLEFDKDESAAFVYKSWLDAKGDTEFVKGHIQNWLVEFDKDESAQFVYKSWLDAKGDTEFVSAHIQNWLVEFDKDKSATFVYTSWLRAKGDMEFIKPHIQNWLTALSESESARYIYTSWLDRKEDMDGGFLEKDVLNWLAIYASRIQDAQFVINACLKAGISLERIEPLMLNWLEIFKFHPKAFFVFLTWINQKGSIQTILPYMTSWLEKNELAQQPLADTLKRAIGNAEKLT